MRRRLLNLLVAIDQLAYVLLTFGYGSPDETLSAAAYRQWLAGRPAGVFKPIIDALFWPVQRDHCQRSYWSERNRTQLPGGYR